MTEATSPVSAVNVNAEATKAAKEINFEALRKQLDETRAENAQFREKLNRLEKEKPAPRLPYKDDDDEESDEPYLDHKSFKKKMNRFEADLDKKIDAKAEEKAKELIAQERRTDYLKQNPDFEKVMSAEVLQKFAEKHPAMAQAIVKMPDGFERQQLIYEAIKTTGIDKPPAPTSTIQQKIDENRKSPFYVPSSMGSAPYNGQSDFSPAGQKNAYEKLKELKSRLRI